MQLVQTFEQTARPGHALTSVCRAHEQIGDDLAEHAVSAFLKSSCEMQMRRVPSNTVLGAHSTRDH